MRSKLNNQDEVNEESFELLTHCPEPEKFCQGAAKLGELARHVPQAIDCVFLRLVARLAKVLRLLKNSPGPKLILAAQEWANSQVRRVEESLMGQMDVLLKVRDVGMAEGCVATAADVSSLLPKIMETGTNIALMLASIPTSKCRSPKVEKAVEISDDSQTPSTVPAEPAEQPEPSMAEPSAPSSSEPATGLKRKRQRAEPAPAQAAFDIFSEPLITDLPEYPIAKAKASHPSHPRTVRSAAPVEEGDSMVTRGGIEKPRRGYNVWTEAEENRVIDGIKRYGKNWSIIRECCNLQHRKSGDIKDKWRVLQKNGRLPS